MYFRRQLAVCTLGFIASVSAQAQERLPQHQTDSRVASLVGHSPQAIAELVPLNSNLDLAAPSGTRISRTVAAAAQQLPAAAPQVPQRDAKGISLLQNSVAAMGKTVPRDSVATGNVTIVAGSLTTSGTIRILTRGTDQTLEHFSAPQFSRKTIYSRLTASENDDSGRSTNFSLERSVTSRSVLFPLPFLAAALSNPDEAIQFLGAESTGQGVRQHVRIWNTFSSTSSFQALADFTTTDIWLDAVTALPSEISFVRRDGGGSLPRIPTSFSYSNFQNVSGLLYPYEIQESINGTPWATITIQVVSFGAGLSDTDFPVTAEAN